MEKRFTMLDHNYMNTGGHCMVSVFTVFDRSVNALRYVIANDEGFNYQTMDTVGHEPPEDITSEELILAVHDWCELLHDTPAADMMFEDDEWKLFKYCQFEFYKKYCKDFKTKIKLPVDQLSPELYNKLSPAYIEWSRDKEIDVETDGYEVYRSELYNEESEKWLIAICDFRHWLEKQTDVDCLEEMADECFVIAIAGRSVRIPWTADSYEAINQLLKDTIEEW